MRNPRVLIIQGPRKSGKSELVRHLTAAGAVVRLDTVQDISKFTVSAADAIVIDNEHYLDQEELSILAAYGGAASVYVTTAQDRVDWGDDLLVIHLRAEKE